METKQLKKKNSSQIYEEFNLKHPKGTAVKYWNGSREGAPDGKTTTRSEAWPMCSQPCVLLEGVSGDIAHTHIRVIEPGPQICQLDTCA